MRFAISRAGGDWGMLPVHFPPLLTVDWWFRRLVRHFLFRTIHDVPFMLDCEREGHEQSHRQPSLTVSWSSPT